MNIMLWFVNKNEKKTKKKHYTLRFIISYLLLAQMLGVKIPAYKGQKTVTLDVFSTSVSFVSCDN